MHCIDVLITCDIKKHRHDKTAPKELATKH